MKHNVNAPRRHDRVGDQHWPRSTPRAMTLFMLALIAATLISQAQIRKPEHTDIPRDAATDLQIDKRVRSFLTELNKNSSPFWELPGSGPSDTLSGLQARTPVDLSGVDFTEKTITVNGKPLVIHVVRPAGISRRLPVFMFFHGGVWIAGNFENHKRLVRDLVVASEAVAVFPDYTYIREAHYPTQINQAYAATQWVVDRSDELNVDGSRLAVVGNSVGGNMAAVVALMAKNRSGPSIRFQALLFPALDPAADSASYRAYSTGRFLPRAFMQYGWKLYAPDPKTHSDPYVSPLAASAEELKGVAPAYILTVENDILRDEGEAYARTLDEAGVDVTSVRYNRTIHDFMILNSIRDLPGTKSAIRQTAAEIQDHLK